MKSLVVFTVAVVSAVSAYCDVLKLESDSLAVKVDRENGTVSALDKRSGREWKGYRLSAIGKTEMTDIRKENDGIAAALVFDKTNGIGNVKYRLEGAELSVEIGFTDIPAKGRMFPAPFVSCTNDAAIVPIGEGFRFPMTNAGPVLYADMSTWSSAFSMPFYGVVDKNDECGWMAIIETPNDARVRFRPGMRSTLGFMAPLWYPEFGKSGYVRKVRFVFFDKGGYVAMAKRYRAYAKKTGLFKTFAEKMKERPLVERLPGAANVWYFRGMKEPRHSEVAAEMHEAGIGRFLWSSGAPTEDIKKIAAMPGVLIGRYDVCRDVYYPELLEKMGVKMPLKDEICRNTSAWPDDIIWNKGDDSNSWRRAWGVTCKDGKRRNSAAQCDIPAVDRLRRNLKQEMAEKPFTARFIDVLTSVGWEECYNPRHPMTRTVSRRAKLDLLKMLCDEFSLVVGSESGMDAAIPYCDYFEGMLSPGLARMPHGRQGYTRTDIFKDDGTIPRQLTEKELDRFVRFAMNEKCRIPLFELVYHDCACSHWYWYDYSNHPICFWGKRDCFNALYGTAPMYIFNYEQWKTRKAEFVESWKRVGKIARDTGFSEMLSHRAVNEDRTVQESVFADGTKVTVDFRTEKITVTR